MKRHRNLTLGALCCAAFFVSLVVAPRAPAKDFTVIMQASWVATANWLNCDQTSQTNECANWQTPDGAVFLTCCVPASALGTSDLEACRDGGQSRGGRPEL